MAKPTDKIKVTLTRSEWNLLLAKLTNHDVEVRNAAAIKFTNESGLA